MPGKKAGPDVGRHIPERVIEEVKFRNDIVDVIGQYVQLKRSGSTYKACCPFHKEKTPSFNVNPDRQMYKCFGCGEGGNVISFMMKHQGMDFLTAVRALAERAGIGLELEEDDGRGRHTKLLYEVNREVTAFYQRCLKQTRGAAAARKYLKERMLDGEIAEEFKLGYAPGGWGVTLEWGARHKFSEDLLEAAGLVLRSNKPKSRNRFYDRFRDRLMFPILDSQGRVVGFSARILTNDKSAPKYVNSPETDIFKKSRVLYALDKARQHIVKATNREAVICEGQIDVIRCHQAGIKTAIASQGTAFTPDHARALKNYADSVVLAFDSDDAGRKAAIKTAVIFMDAGIIVRVAALPPGEDPDSYILAKGAAAFRNLLDDAGSVIRFQIASFRGGVANPHDVAAIERIARDVLHTIAHSSNAVQEACMLNEAAELLHLPVSALQEDLKKAAEEERKLAERQARLSRTAATSSVTPEVRPPDDAGFVPDYYEADDGEQIDELALQARGGAVRPASAAGGARNALRPAVPHRRSTCSVSILCIWWIIRSCGG